MERVVANIVSLVDRARSEQVPVVWVQHADDQLEYGSDGWQYVPELVPDEREPVVHKRFGDSFEDTDLETVLADRGVGRLVVVGAQTDACIRSTLHGALGRGYDAVLVADAHTTEDQREWGAPLAPAEVIAFTNFTWQWSEAPGRRGSTVDTAEVAFS